MSQDRRHLKLVPPPPPETPKQAVRRRLKAQPKLHKDQAQCRRCSGREYVKSSIGRKLCTQCWSKGELVELT